MKKFLLSLAVGAALATSAQAATISVGTEATFAPFEFMDEQTKQLTGFDMESLDSVASNRNHRCDGCRHDDYAGAPKEGGFHRSLLSVRPCDHGAQGRCQKVHKF